MPCTGCDTPENCDLDRRCWLDYWTALTDEERAAELAAIDNYETDREAGGYF